MPAPRRRPGVSAVILLLLGAALSGRSAEPQAAQPIAQPAAPVTAIRAGRLVDPDAGPC